MVRWVVRGRKGRKAILRPCTREHDQQPIPTHRGTWNRIGTRVDVMLAGDFNRHDHPSRGDEASPDRKGQADLMI
jgi:hypothetical protein